MEKINFLNMFVINSVILWVFLLATYLYRAGTSRLKKKGYNEEYITFIKKDSRDRALGIAIAVPLLELLAALIVWLISGKLETGKHLAYVMLVFFLLVIPFPIMDARKTAKKYKELAIKTKSEVLIDLNYRTLHRVFKPPVELAAAVLCVLYFVLFLDPLQPVMIHLAILWFLYFSARFARYMNRPLLRDSYLYIFVFMVINHLLVLFHLVRETLKVRPHLEPGEYLFGGFLALILVAKLIYYFSNFPGFKREVNKES